MADILDEVLSDHQDEKKLFYFRKLLPIVITATIIIVIVMVVYNWYSSKQDAHNAKVGDILLKAINVGETDHDTAFNSLNNLVEQEKKGKIRELFLLEQAGMKITSKDYISAKSILEKIIDTKEFYSLTRSYAKILWLCLVIDQKIILDQENEKFKNYVNSFSNEKQEFFATASLIKAFWYIRNKQVDLAKIELRNIISSNTTLVIKTQAQALLSSVD